MTDVEVSKNLQANLRRVMEERGLSRYALAKQANESQMNIGRVCKGKCIPKIGMVMRIAAALHVGVDDLLQPPKQILKQLLD